MVKQEQTDSGRSVGPTIKLPLLPLRDILVFPSTVVPLFVGRGKSIQAIEQAMSGNKELLLAAQIKAKTNDPEKEDIYTVGTISNILQFLKLPDGTVKILVEGQKRARIESYTQTEPFFHVEASILIEDQRQNIEDEAMIRTVKMAFDHYVRLNKRIPPEMLISISQIDSESKLSDTLVAHLPNLKLQEKQDLLEENDPRKRLEVLYGFIQSEVEIIRLEKKIRARVKRQMEKTQKEYYLNEQMAAIQRELGEKDDGRAEIMEMEASLEKKALSTEAKEKLAKEIKKLKQMSTMSAEATVVRNYIETVLSLPWGEFTQDIRDTNFAETVLNRDHFGLAKIKERVLEYLAVKNLSGDMKGPILCLVGPPGVGKTSLAKSIAESLGRKFVRIALGGVRDQAEIRGHRKTYIGSMPGKIILSLKKSFSSNPVILLDEVDKLGMDHRGDPAAALLEVLDPEQNSRFNDHYLDLDYDLSKCLFISTANAYDGIPIPLLDRMEIIDLSGYIEEEKLQIALQFLIPKQIKENGLEKHSVAFQPASVIEIIRYYTREAGVRNLERELASILRKATRKHMKIFEEAKTLKPVEKTANSSPVASLAEEGSKGSISAGEDFKDFLISEVITVQSVTEYLGAHKYRITKHIGVSEIGLCTGLAWTSVGGEVLTTEVTILPGKGKLTITGKLGDVMQESAQAALSYVRSRADFLGLEPDFYQKIDIHMHIPEGATPKDGPSAGLCMATAMTSALTTRPVRQDVAMTGEITLRGRALPIGGLKEKVLAAHRAGIKKVLYPKENAKDLKDLPPAVFKETELVPISHMDEVLLHALVWKDEKDASSSDELLKKLIMSTSFHDAANDLSLAC
ncbi:MAG: endopeptidase La [Oligoflexales bacterium]|nr:endopeptidase La [Oligoflexales bacterium]